MKLTNSERSWGLIHILLHWVMAIMVIAMFVVGLLMVDLDYYSQWYKTAPHLHKSFGLLLLLLTVFRLFWLIINHNPGSLDSHKQIEKIAAKTAHYLLYLLLLLIMISGYLISTADGRAIEVFNWFEVPAISLNIENQEDIAGKIHFILAVSLISLVVIHAAGAIKHHFIDKDITLLRMLGKTSR